MNLPTFTPNHISKVDQTIELTGSVSSEEFQGQSWIADNALGYIGHKGEAPIQGKWSQENNKWRFVIPNPKSLKFKTHEPLQFYDAYYGERVFIVLTQQEWIEIEFKPKENWDHEHCDICWAKITIDAPKYFRNREQDIACPDCYNLSIVPRSLSFIDSSP